MRLRKTFLAPIALIAPFAATACVAPDPRIVAAVDDVRTEQLSRHVEALCAIGPRPAGDDAATERTLRYLEGQLRQWGYAPAREPFGCYVSEAHRQIDEDGKAYFTMTMKSSVQHNLIAERAGSDGDAAAVEFGAHYDSVPWGPGADDNASGTAALLEAARVLATRQPRKTVRFVFFAMEEQGLVGSREHVRNLVKADDLPEGMLSLDMIGFTSAAPGSQQTPVRIPLLFSPPDVGDFLLVAGDWSSGWLGALFEQCIDTYVPELPYYSLNRLAGWFSDATRGDHLNYWQAGIASTAVVDGMDYRNPNYHLKTDTADTLDLTFLTRGTQAVVATALTWAELAEQVGDAR